MMRHSRRLSKRLRTFLSLFLALSVRIGIALSRGARSTATKTLELQQKTIKNLWSICAHLQNPDLYTPQWADACRIDATRKTLVASKSIKQGEALSLYPIHVLGISKSPEEKDWIVWDAPQAEEHLSTPSPVDATFRHDIRILHEDGVFSKKNSLFIDVSPKRPLVPGWLAHFVKVHESKQPSANLANCLVVPLLGATPLCALVATCDLNAGDCLALQQQNEERDVVTLQKLAEQTATKYASEIGELHSYLQMAYPSPTQESHEDDIPPKDPVLFQHPFYTLNQEYPRLEQFHESPDIWLVHDFLTDDECDRLRLKVEPHLRPCLVKREDSGVVEQDISRTSFDANVPRNEVPGIVQKILALFQADDERRLEILQVLRYQEGQKFERHTDGFEGPVTACGFEDSGRLVTLFVYLNDVSHGGATRFTRIDKEIRPQKGMAVVHFPNTLGLEEDVRTEHEGCCAVDDKWLLVTWLWKDVLSDPLYSEANLAPLSSDLI